MASIWSEGNRFEKWLEIELAVCEVLARRGEIPEESFKTISERAGFDVQRIAEIEETVKHDVIAFLTSVAEKVGEDSRYIHMGLTSSDILDTSFAVLLREASGMLIEDMEGLLAVLKVASLLCLWAASFPYQPGSVTARTTCI